MSFASFWAQIYDLHMDGMNAWVMRKIIEIVDHIEDIDLAELQPRWGEFFQAHISLDIRQPLPRGKRVALGCSNYVLVHFKYERLPQFYYCCGLLGHGDQDCLMWIQYKDEFDTNGFTCGPWLRVGNTALKSRSRGEMKQDLHEGSPSVANLEHDRHRSLSSARSPVVDSTPSSNPPMVASA